MKKKILSLLLLFIICLTATVSARPHNRYDRWEHPSYRHKDWHHAKYSSFSKFKWYDHRDRFSPSRYHMKEIYSRDWNSRFPGLRSYKWRDTRGEGFWYRGRRINDAVLFFNHANRMVGVGFVYNGSFIFIRDDHRAYSNHDSFFISWWRHR